MAEVRIHTATCEFRADVRGSAPSAVFLHGFGSDLHTWDSLWAALGPRSALRYDLRGFGASCARSAGPYDHANDLLDILDTCGLSRCDVVGVSMGGGVALNFALDHPQRVRSLVLINPALVGWEWSASWQRRWKDIVTLARSGALSQAKEQWWAHPLFATTRDSAGAAALRDSIMRYSGAHWIKDHHVSKQPDVERLHRLATPTLLLTGERDLEDFRLMAALIEASTPAVRRIDLPGRGHSLQLEDPQACAAHIDAFWKMLDGA